MDWIKVDSHLSRKPEVLAISRTLGIPIPHAVGLLVEFWSWVDANSSDGDVTLLSLDDVDTVTAHPGFASALRQVRWLNFDNCVDAPSQISIPNFDRHNGQSAKKRALTAQRMVRHRSKSRNATVDGAVTHIASTKASPDKIREDINTIAHSAPKVRRAIGAKLAHSGFDDFWAMYPRKLDKVKALRAWNALKPDEPLRNRIFECLRETVWNSNKIFIPYPASWINGERWLDEGPAQPVRELVL